MLEVPSFGIDLLHEAGATAEDIVQAIAGRVSSVSDEDALAWLGIDRSAVMRRLEPELAAQPRTLPWTDLALQVLADASDAAIADAAERGLPAELHIAGTDWLFLALVQRDEGVASEVITSLGVDRVSVVERMEAWLPIVHRFRQRMLQNPTHGRYRALLAAWGRLEPADQAATRAALQALHHAHDQVIERVATRLKDPGADGENVAAAYFSELARPVEDAALALAPYDVST